MELNAVVRCAFEFVIVKVLNDTFLPSCSDRLISRLTPCEHLHMNHIVLLFAQFGVIVDSAVKNEVARFELFELESDREGVELVSLIPAVQLEAELLSEVPHSLADKRAAIEENGGVVVFLAFLPVALGIRHSEVLFDCRQELFPQLLFENRVLPVHIGVGRHIIPVFQLIFLCLSEPFKVLLQGRAASFHLTKAKQLPAFLLDIARVVSMNLVLAFLHFFS